MKTCYKCNQNKELTEFYFRKDSNSYRNECKECTKKSKAIRESKPGVKEARALLEKQRRVEKKEQIKKVRDARYADPEQRKIIRANGRKAYYKLKENKPELLRVNNQEQRVKRKYEISKETSSTKQEIKAWIKEELKICTYCGISCESSYHIDHIDPLSKGGTHTLSNLTVSCPTCNFSKNSSLLLIWMAKLTNRSKG